MIAKTPGKRIRDARKMKGFTAAELARRTSVSPTAVALWEKGSVPRPPVMERVATALGVSSDFLLTGTAPPALKVKKSVAEITSEAEAQLAEAMGYATGRVRVKFEVLEAPQS